ncbi:MAG: potassium transporter TrkG [Planctomycetaceae bacterium]
MLSRAELTILVVGVFALLIHGGSVGVSAERVRELSGVVLVCMSLITVLRIVGFVTRYSAEHRFAGLVEARLPLPVLWILGLTGLWLMNVRGGDGGGLSANPAVLWTEALLAATAIVSVLNGCRLLATKTHNSAVLLVGSFLVMITVGTLLLKLPACRAAGEDSSVQRSAEWNVALFTATSATCVTGLIVEPTGSYWSPIGHVVIFGLFQIGGLGILTFGAFLAVLSGRRGLQFREARTLRNMLDAESVHDSRRLLLTILSFTVCVEIIGAVCLSGLWSDRSLFEQAWYSLFHAVSAFCNAGFSLHDDGFLGMGQRWQVWGPLTVLIILGGLGFSVVQDLWTNARARLTHTEATPLFRTAGIRPRLTLHSTLVLYTTFALLASGAVAWFMLESLEAPSREGVGAVKAADAWFQSVTFRTAGFNTVDHQHMHPATKLLAIFLMFIGAAPGSTGGGIKTVVFAIAVLNVWAVFKGRNRVELFGRCLPITQVSRALSMIAVGILIVMLTAGLLVIFERHPELFIDHLFEATSAFATVGVSAGITPTLTMPSRMLICVVMFLGRVGPITLLLAMAAPVESGKYDYPEERVSLG